MVLTPTQIAAALATVLRLKVSLWEGGGVGRGRVFTSEYLCNIDELHVTHDQMELDCFLTLVM